MNASVVVLDKVARATVGIHSLIPASHPSATIGLGTERRGTGTLASADGLIVTVSYMLMGAESVIVTLSNGDQLNAKVVAKDYVTNLGLLKIEGRGYVHLRIVSSAGCVTGQEVFMVSSLGGDKRIADSGIITYLGPFDAAWEFVLDRCVCVTASSLNIGFNGGAICNTRGEAIAFSYLNFADPGRAVMGIPGECYLNGRDELVRHGHRVSAQPRLWLGLLSYTVRDHVVIASVMPGSPGEQAGLRQGDLVLEADGRELHDRRALYEAVNRRRPGETVKLKILRNNVIHDVAVRTIRVEEYLD